MVNNETRLQIIKKLIFLNDILEYMVLKYDYFFEGKVINRIPILQNIKSFVCVRLMKVIDKTRICIVMEKSKDMNIIYLNDRDKDLFFRCHSDSIEYLCVISPHFIVTSDKSNCIIIWNLKRGDKTTIQESKKILGLYCLDDNTFIYTIYKKIKEYSIENRKCNTISINEKATFMAVISSEEVIIGFHEGLKIYNIRNNTNFVYRYSKSVYYMFSILLQNKIIMGNKFHEILIYDLLTKDFILSMKVRSQITSCCLHSNSRVVISFMNGDLLFYDYEHNQFKEVFNENDGFITCVGNISETIISAGRGNLIKMWN